jgi:4a-hydroxytetrahydrobiopterin dehydratase
MSQFSQLKCEACKAGAPSATDRELKEFLRIHENWERIENHRVSQITRVYEFDNFIDALAFSNQVGNIAEKEGHHPALLTEWGKVTVSWWTHKIGGLHRNDLIMGARTDDLYG